MASTPAIGPTPKQKTKISAQTSSGTVRAISSIRRVIQTSEGRGERLRAAVKDRRNPAITPSVVAMKAMSSVSTSRSSQTGQRQNQCARSRPSVARLRSGNVLAM